MFLRRSKHTRNPLAVAMSGVRLGERVLQVGVDDARLVGLIASKTAGSAAPRRVWSPTRSRRRKRKAAPIRRAC